MESCSNCSLDCNACGISSLQIIVSPPLQVDNLHVIKPENTDVLVGGCSQFNKINPGLVRVAHQLASRNEIDGLLLTGVTLKAGVTLASSCKDEDNPTREQ